MFGRKKDQGDARPKWADLSTEERAEAAESFLGHLVDVATAASLHGTQEAVEEATHHIAGGIRNNERGLLEAALGKAVILEGHARAEHVRAEGEALLKGLHDLFAGIQPEDLTGEGREEGQERPTDLLPDDEPTTAPEAVSEPQEAAEKVWPEDRR